MNALLIRLALIIYCHQLCHVFAASYLQVTSLIVEPYLMINPKYVNQTGNARYMGYLADLLHHLSNTVGFEYRLELVDDGGYGIRREDGSWDGMIGELMHDRADIAAAPLYVTDSRKHVISFTLPFMTVQASLLIDKRKYNQLSPPIRSARDLLDQTLFHYGTLNTGILVHEFKNTNNTDYKTLWNNMHSFTGSVFTNQNADGINRVRDDYFVYILPSNIADYVAFQEPCDLLSIDAFLMTRHFALAMQKNSLMLNDINKGFETLTSAGVLNKLYHKWWIKESRCAQNGGIKSSHVISTNEASRRQSLIFLFVVLLLCMHLM